jgi:hypothetical protein
MGLPTFIPPGKNMPSGKSVSTGIFSSGVIHHSQEY